MTRQRGITYRVCDVSTSSRAKDHYDEIMSLFDCGHFRKEKDIWKKHRCILRNLNIEYSSHTLVANIPTLYKCIMVLLQFVGSYISICSLIFSLDNRFVMNSVL